MRGEAWLERGGLDQGDHLMDAALEAVCVDGNGGCTAERRGRTSRPRKRLSAQFREKSLHRLSLDAGYAGDTLPDRFEIKDTVLHIFREAAFEIFRKTLGVNPHC